MADRELLELAAKAYFAQDVADGVCSFWWDEKEDSIVFIHGDNQDHNGHDVELLWVPLDEDGDALRLAVKLRINLVMLEHIVDAQCGNVLCHEPWENDSAAATRRAIVRAAAEIGKAMP